MGILDYLDYVSEDKKEAFKADAEKAVYLSSIEDAGALIKKNDFLKRAFDQAVSFAVNNHDDKFKSESLPKLIQEEYKRLHPDVDPKDLKIAEFEKKFERLEMEKNREVQKTRALQKNAELGLPVEIIDRFIGLTDAETDDALSKLQGVLTPWKEKAVFEAMRKESASATPRTGTNGKTMSMSEFQKLAGPAQAEYMTAGGDVTE